LELGGGERAGPQEITRRRMGATRIEWQTTLNTPQPAAPRGLGRAQREQGVTCVGGDVKLRNPEAFGPRFPGVFPLPEPPVARRTSPSRDHMLGFGRPPRMIAGLAQRNAPETRGARNARFSTAF